MSEFWQGVICGLIFFPFGAALVFVVVWLAWGSDIYSKPKKKEPHPCTPLQSECDTNRRTRKDDKNHRTKEGEWVDDKTYWEKPSNCKNKEETKP